MNLRDTLANLSKKRTSTQNAKQKYKKSNGKTATCRGLNNFSLTRRKDTKNYTDWLMGKGWCRMLTLKMRLWMN